jgi:hydrogenase maturation factor
MKKLFFLLAATVFAGSGPVPALADDAGGSKAERIAEVYNELQLPGTIEKIDYKKGLVTLSSVLGNVELSFPPENVRGLQSGDPVVVDLGFSQQGRAIGMNRMADTLETFNELQVTGTIRQINYRKGELSLGTKAGDVTLNFPPTALKELKRDDVITVNMGYSKEGRTIKKR